MLRPDELPLPFVAGQVKRLVSSGFNAPKGLRFEDFAGEIVRATRGWTEAEFVAAMNWVIDNERYWPKIGAITQARPCKAAPPASSGESGSRCRACGEEPFVAGYETGDGRVFGRYRCGCPTGGGGWDTERARAYRDPGQRDAAA